MFSESNVNAQCWILRKLTCSSFETFGFNSKHLPGPWSPSSGSRQFSTLSSSRYDGSKKKTAKKETKWKNVRNHINFASCFSAIAIGWPREKTRDANSQVYLRNATQDSLGAVLLVLQRFANFRELLADAHEEILHFNFAVHFYVSACSNSTGKLMIDELESGILLVACSRQLSPQLPHSHLSAHIKCPRTIVPGCTKNKKRGLCGLRDSFILA